MTTPGSTSANFSLGSQKFVTEPMSVYLDFLRFLAALAVLFGHMEQYGLYMSWMPLHRFSHDAVIIFFVISGLIIRTTTIEKNRGALDYAIARAARIYSVAIPAIIFSILAATAVPLLQKYTNQPPPSVYFQPNSWSTFSSLLFLNESWSTSTSLPLNSPYWSLCYEVWYYFLFGAYVYSSSRIRWPLLGMLAIITGPSILLLFPIWLAGAALSAGFQSTASRWSPRTASFIFLFTIICLISIEATNLDITVRTWLKTTIPAVWRLGASQRFMTDYLVGGMIFLNILAYSRLPASIHTKLTRHRNIFKYLAGFSFTLYLFHFPIIVILGWLYPNSGHSLAYSLIAALGTLAACLGISYLTERQLPHWKRILTKFSAPLVRT